MSTLFGQLKALLWRNILLKKRNKKQLIQELFYPIYFVLLLSLIKTLAKPSTTPPTPEFPQYNLADPRFILNTKGNILVVPDTPEVKDIIANVEGYIGSLNVVYSATEAEAVALYKATSNNVSAGIVFNDTGDNPVYSIRTTYNDDLLSTKLFTGKGECLKADRAATDSNCKANKYLTTGFAWLQRAIEAAFIKKKSATFSLPEVFVQMMPKEEFTSDVTYIQYLASVYFVMAYSSFVNFLTVNIVAEKEKKIREGMKMMGLRDSVLWLSWSLTYTLLIAVVTGVITIIAYGFGFYSRSSNLFIFFLLMLLYGISIITMAFAVTPFFRKAQAAGMVTSFATIAISCLYFAVSLTRETTRDGYHYPYAPGGVWAICLLSPVALALGIDQGIYLDTAKGGMTFANISEGEFPLSGPIIMLVVDIILYAVIAVYFDHVIPGEFGPRYPPWYFLMPSYYCQKKRSGDSELSALTSNEHQSINGSFTGSDPNIEPVHQDLKDKAGVRINNISKDFPSKEETVHAVRGLSLDMYEGHITALLGHNGAGKTTLINMLCGLTPPTSGTATIYDMDVSNSGDMERLRAMCGVCPQHNILYDDLTTKEHLIVFAGIKGVAEDGKEEAVTRAMKDADIYEKADTFAKNLSGGQKRKLSVAMALIGDPKIIFLDEPTAGMDPFSRRHLWSLLQNSKKGRIILLTTHFMDEADILADRKAIISHGTLRCLGSSLFLKNRFGIGYHLNMVVEPDCNAETVSSVLSEQVKGVEMKRSHAKELAFTLPLSEVSTFSNMFSSLEQKVNGTTQAEKLGIKSYGVSMTTLEEVFLKLGEDTDENPAPGHGIENPAYDENGLRSTQRVFSDGESQINLEMKDHSNPTQSLANKPTVENLASQRFWALMKIRFLIIIRNPMAVIFQIVLPIVFVVVGCVLSTLGPSAADSSNPKPVSLFATSATYASAPLAAIDSQNDVDSTTFISKVNDTWQVDKNLNISLLLYPNHILGFNLQQYQTSNNDINYTALYNTTALHSLPTIINIMSNTLYSLVTGGSNISGSSLPWPSISTQLTYSGSAFSATLVVALAFAVLSPGFAMFLVVERQTKTRGQQRVAGITFNMYWASLFILNCTMFAIPVVICIIIVGAVPVASLSSAGAMVSLVLLFITYIPANILVVYNLSFAFDAYETCQAVLPNLMIFGTLLPYVAVSLTDMLGSADAATAIHYVMTVINPLYALIGGLYYIDRIHRVSLIARTEIEFGMYFQGDSNILITILMPIVHCGLLYVLLRVLDVRSTGGNSKEALNCQGTSKVNDIPEDNQDVIGDEDEDVAEERNRVNSLQTGAQDAPVAYVQNIRKEFAKDIKAFCKKTKQKTNVAVRNATFAVDCGEVFGLLGPNGAGKTTALNMIIAETGPTRGKVIVAGHDIRSSMSSAFQAMGYCAQHDALWEKITLREHIEFYGLLRGLSQKDSVTMADGMIASLKVEEHAKKGAKKLSGGTKRKLSYAISMLGSPEIVLLDEPSTGMDPQSKRFLWDTISGSFEGTKRGAILTTHYMEEADALCSRVAIMVNGKIECLGPTQHLKDKYGSGYLLEVKLKTGGHGEDIEARMDSLESHVVALFPQASCMERFEERGQYKIPRDNVKSLSETFSSLEQTKQTHDVEEYSFSQSTLEQVFLDFAKKQHEEGEEDNVPKSLMRQLSDAGGHRDSDSRGRGNISVRM
ncbi:cholesterol transporter ABCA5-like isoform X1 [Haliotis cracherodii]|uniref:cholesterol transporter ABCA5-like isoform X1 n=1 Tax=Haliotis cracherodii TaxID=6455 RepID=UPI0039E9E85B